MRLLSVTSLYTRSISALPVAATNCPRKFSSMPNILTGSLSRDLGATPWQSFRHVVLPIIGPSVVGVAMFGFTLSWDEIARTSQAIGDQNTLPLELQGLTTSVTTPVISRWAP